MKQGSYIIEDLPPRLVLLLSPPKNGSNRYPPPIELQLGKFTLISSFACRPLCAKFPPALSPATKQRLRSAQAGKSSTVEILVSMNFNTSIPSSY
ncbi:hypothetical protein CUMW_157970 [Citrus unshiu]|uniref:Uncharacterized protein n=1 Tax=Citrus unshiu TaxID=55188 RepID=A0A2H5PQG9_CITUN|nr:hypothetical protein CUMW_157970 [Citrus unshiu]